MPSRRVPNRRTPTCDDDALHERQGDLEHRLLLGDPAWTAWLGDPAHSTFAYSGQFGAFTARREQRGARAYWYAYHSRAGRLHKIYLGRAEALTPARLQAAARDLNRPGPASDRPIADGRAAPFDDGGLVLVGRDREQSALGDLLAAALAGRGGLTLIGGEAGIGKSALAEALARRATERGALVLVGRCHDLTDTPPYGPWTEVFAQWPRMSGRPAAPPLVVDEGGASSALSQAALFARVQAFLAAAAARRPLVLLLEDLHWADPASLDLLRFLARGLAALPLLLVVTFRADELTRRHPLYSVLPLLAREAPARRLDLRRLPAEAARGLVAARFRLPPADQDRLVAYLHDRAEGNPFFVGEVLRTLEEEGVLRPVGDGWELGDLAGVRVSPFLRQVIDGRLARLGEETRGLLGVAAVIGHQAPLALWATVAGVAETTLLEVVERAVEIHVLEEAPDDAGVRFVHALIRETLYEGLLGPRRQAWHQRVGEALVAAGSTDLDAVAYHFRQANDARAVEWLVQAGNRAQRAYAWLTAATRFEAALALMRDSAVQERGWLLGRLAWLRRYADPRQAVGLLDEALQAAHGGEDRALAAYATLFRGLFRCYAGDIRQGLDELTAGVAALDVLPPPDRRRGRVREQIGLFTTVVQSDMGRGVLAHMLALAGRYAEAHELGEQSRALTPPLDGVLGGSSYADAHQALGLVHAASGAPDAARQAFAQARALYRTVEHHFQIAMAAMTELHAVLVPYLADQPAERERLAAEAEHEWTQASGVWARVLPALARLPLLVLGGQWREARRLALEACAAGGIVSQRFFANALLGELARAQGDADLAWEQVRWALPDGPLTAPGDAWLLPALVLQRLAAGLALDAGDLAAARAWLEAHDRWLGWSGAVLGRADGHLGWAHYHRASGDLAAARASATRGLTDAGAPRQPMALLAAHRLLGEIEAAAGHQRPAESHLQAALALADACAAPYERALTLLVLAELRLTDRDRPAVVALLDEVCAACAPLDARLALARADTLAAATATAAPLGRPAGLSGREAQVLRLVAASLSNAEVAAELALSPRTVEQHLRSIYNKLGVSSRSAATRFAIEQGLG